MSLINWDFGYPIQLLSESAIPVHSILQVFNSKLYGSAKLQSIPEKFVEFEANICFLKFTTCAFMFDKLVDAVDRTKYLESSFAAEDADIACFFQVSDLVS